MCEDNMSHLYHEETQEVECSHEGNEELSCYKCNDTICDDCGEIECIECQVLFCRGCVEGDKPICQCYHNYGESDSDEEDYDGEDDDNADVD